MSFWPFGPTATESQIDTIINDYLHTLNSVEPDRYKKNNIRTPDPHPGCVINEEKSVDDTEENALSLHIESETRNDTLKSPRSNRSSFSNVCKSVESSKSSINLMPAYCLNNKFIKLILREPNLLDELIKENKKLLDFICFGYFYQQDDFQTKIYHIDYLIDRLITCLDEVQDDKILMEKKILAQNNLEDDILFSDDKENAQVKDRDTDYSSSSINNDSDNDLKASPLRRPPDIFDEYIEATRIAEIITLNVSLLTKLIVENKQRMFKLWSLIHHPKIKTDNSIQLTIFLKIQDAFLANKRTAYLNFVRSIDTLVDDVFSHINLPILLDFLLRLLCTDKREDSTGMIDLLSKQHLIPKSIEFLNSSKFSRAVQSIICDFLQQLIEISVNIPVNDISIGPNNLTRDLVSQKTVNQLMDLMLKQKGTVLCNIITLVIELIRKNNSDFDPINLIETTIEKNPPNSRDPIYLGYLLKTFTSCIPTLLNDFWDMDESIYPTYKNQIGESYKKIGLSRIKIVELIAELLHCSNMTLMNSKSAGLIEEERSQYRDSITDELNSILVDDHSESLDDIGTNSHDKIKSTFNDDDLPKTFKIPYVSLSMNENLRNINTIGDDYKIMLFDNHVLPKLLTVFLKHPWNNFWHNVVFDIIQQVFSGRMDFSYNPFLIYSIFCYNDSKQYLPDDNETENDIEDFNIIQDFILYGYRESYNYYRNKSMNLGYIGHLLMIAEDINRFFETYKTYYISPGIYDLLKDNTWNIFTKEIITETKSMYTTILGGGQYIDDGNGNLIPQVPDRQRTDSSVTDKKKEDDVSNENNNDITEISSQDFFTQQNLHDKIGTLWKS